MRVLVTGGRDYPFRERVFQVLDKLHADAGITAVIEGGHWNGADMHARDWAKANGFEPETYRADWVAHGDAAGPIRNAEMVRESRPDVCIGFPTPGEKNKGTRGCMKLARAAGVEVVEIAP
jgi:hypothetical protein